jgi:hypothetical protein
MVAGFPGFELARQVLLARFAQLSDDFGILRGEPVLQFVQGFDRR